MTETRMFQIIDHFTSSRLGNWLFPCFDYDTLIRKPEKSYPRGVGKIAEVRQAIEK